MILLPKADAVCFDVMMQSVLMPRPSALTRCRKGVNVNTITPLACRDAVSMKMETVGVDVETVRFDATR